MLFITWTVHGMRELTDDEILARAEQIKARREVTGPVVLRLCDLPGTQHGYSATPHTYSHTHGGCHACCYRCPR